MTAVVDGSTLLAPDLRAAVDALGARPLTPERLAKLRSRPVPRVPMTGVESSDHPVPGSAAVVRIYRPVDVTGPLPGLLTLHGGGYVMGSPDSDDTRFTRICPALRCLGFSVDYRLAPETAYPGPLEDCYDGLRWVHEHAAELGLDASRLGVGGVSAGGGLAAALTLLARDRAELPIAFQLLECPMLDDRQLTPSSRLDRLAVFSRESNAFGWQAYLGDRYGQDVPATAAPARATDLTGLPPAYVVVGGADGFRDEDVDYAVRLSQAGVPTDLRVYAGVPHGLTMLPPGADVARWEHDADAWLAGQLH